MESTQLDAIAEIIRLTETAIPSVRHRTRFLINMSSTLKSASIGSMRLLTTPLLPSEMRSVESILSDGGLGIYPDLIASSCFTEALFKRFGIELRGRSVNAVFLSLGFESFVKQVFWRGTAHRWYFRGARPDHPGLLANMHEEARRFVE